ncbi:hypothetical protein HY634_00770 [Candidatus Uhrbacteria bacterium]|nr:hypothetical protein [Candidatus Uhrbacteria bacterium]
MPRLPGDIERAMGQSDPRETWYGEEGILRRIGLDDGRYFAKRWRGKHYEGEHAGRSVSYSEESGRTPVSPFWHKVKFYETKLIHDAFPDSTLEMSAAYDPRIVPGADGDAQFMPGTGRPVTVTREVEGDLKLRAERDRIVRAAYDEVFEHRAPNTHGELQQHQGTGAFYRADMAMAERFGRELLGPLVSHDEHLRDKWVDRNIENVRHWYPGSDVLEILEAGLIPIHAGLNFIPTAEPDPERGPQGVYLELAVGDLERLRAKLHAQCADDACRTKIDRRIERYAMYRVLDDLYDGIFIDQHFLNETDALNDSNVMNGAFQMLRAVQERIERDGLADADVWLTDLRDRLRHFWHRTARGVGADEHKRVMLEVFEAIRTTIAGSADGAQDRAA